jgi:endonuclease/exonuclease/phosphatase (EEP) superfamily protein YafD
MPNVSWLPKFKHIFDWFFILATVLLILLSLAGYLGEVNTKLELISHFKLQYLIVSFSPFFFFLLRRQKLWLMISLFCLMINLVEILPWYFPQTSNIANERSSQKIRVLQSNIDKNSYQLSKVLPLIKKEQPELAVLVEFGQRAAKELEELKQMFPYSISHQDVEYDGTVIYSKLPLENTSIKSLGGGRKAVLADVTILGKVISIIAVHPSNAVGKIYVEERNRQLLAIADYVEKVKNPLLLGDFNITMWSPYYKHLVNKAKLQNTRKGFGILPTWPTFLPLFYIPIDHCLIRQNLNYMEVIKTHVGDDVGSDHLPLITDLLISPKSN